MRVAAGVACLLLATAALAAPAAPAGAAPGPAPELVLRFPLVLRDPVRGTSAEIRPGAAVTHLVFFATWCPPCRAELGRLAELQAAWGRQGYRLVLVAVAARQTDERLSRFVEEESPPGELLFDPSGELEKGCGLGQVPAHVVLDARGAVVWRSASLSQGVVPAIERALGSSGRGRS